MVIFWKPCLSLVNLHCYVGQTFIQDNSKILLHLGSQNSYNETIELTCQHRTINNNSIVIDKDTSNELNLKLNISQRTSTRKSPIITGLALNRTSATDYRLTLTKSLLLSASPSDSEDVGHDDVHERDDEESHGNAVETSFHLRFFEFKIYHKPTNNEDKITTGMTMLIFDLVELFKNYTDSSSTCVAQKLRSPQWNEDFLVHRGPCDSDAVFMIARNLSKCNDSGKIDHNSLSF